MSTEANIPLNVKQGYTLSRSEQMTEILQTTFSNVFSITGIFNENYSILI